MSHAQRTRLRVAAAALALASFVGQRSSTPLHAAGVIAVNSTSSTVNPTDGLCTLIEAIDAANNDTPWNGVAGECASASGEDTIQVPAGIYTLTAVNHFMFGRPFGLPDVRTWMKIQGAGPGLTVIERSPAAMDFALVMVLSNGDPDPQQHGKLTLTGVTMRNGRAPDRGGALLSNSEFDTAIVHCAFENNRALDNSGGAIYTTRATIDGSTFSGNYARYGGGAVLHELLLTVRNSTFSGNRADSSGGAIDAGFGATLDIQGSLISHNTAATVGGGIEAYAATVRDSTIERNGAGTDGGGITALTLVMSNSRVMDNTAPNGNGGGVAIVATYNGWATISDSTISRNLAGSGGGVSGPALTLTNVTVSENIANQSGGGITPSGPFVGNNLTVTDNALMFIYGSGGGINFGRATTISLANSVIAGNVTGQDGRSPDCFAWDGQLTSAGHNLIGNTCGCGVVSAAGDMLGTWDAPIDARLGPLQDNGGPTPTHLPLPGGPLIDTASPLVPGSDPAACEVRDQRGIPRPVDGDGDGIARSDRGAVEKTGNAFPARPGFSMSSYSVDEPAGTARITVVRDDPSGDVDVAYWATAGSAIEGVDFIAAAGTLRFLSGETAKTFDVTILDDVDFDGTKSVRLALRRAADPADGAPYSSAMLFIKDDESIPLASVADVSVVEGDTGTQDVHVIVRLTKWYPYNVSVEYATVDGTAVAGQDYEATSGTIVIGAGNMSGDLVLKVRGDTVTETEERFKLRIWTSAGCASEHRSATITILDNDVPNRAPTVSSPGDQLSAEGTAVSLQIVASDPDGDTRIHSASGLPPGLDINVTTGLITGSLDFNSAGVYTVTVSVSDGTFSASKTFTWTVTNTNRPPTALGDGPYQNLVGALITMSGAASTDPDGNPLTYTWSFGDGSPAVTTAQSSIAHAYAAAGQYTVTLTVSDGSVSSAPYTTIATVTPIPNLNHAPSCAAAQPSIGEIWPPDHKKQVVVSVLGVTDQDGDPIALTITRIWQDEPTNTLGDAETPTDGGGIGTSQAWVRAERSGTPKVPGNGRVYEVFFSASDGRGGSCSGAVKIGVPHDQGKGPAIDDGIRYDSTVAGGPRVK